jgi:cytidine deaminase
MSDEAREKLIQIATQAMDWSYSPYSNYAVGAALLTESDKIYDGANIENAVYPVTICAERVAIFKAVSEGEKAFKAIAVVTRDGGTPCGACRQVMAEFAPDMTVYIADSQGKLHHELSVRGLLPHSFGPANLQES